MIYTLEMLFYLFLENKGQSGFWGVSVCVQFVVTQDLDLGLLSPHHHKPSHDWNTNK